MGITIRIGDAEVRCETSERRAWYEVPIIRHKDAPGDGSNEYDLSYLGRYNLHTITGLEPMMKGLKGAPYKDEAGEWRDCLLAEHPGCFSLERYHLNKARMLREAYIAKTESERAPLISEGKDWGLIHLDWFIYWTEWSISTCSLPSIYNR